MVVILDTNLNEIDILDYIAVGCGQVRVVYLHCFRKGKDRKLVIIHKPQSLEFV